MERFQIVMENDSGELDRREAPTAVRAAIRLAEMVASLGVNVRHGDTFRVIDTQRKDDEEEALADRLARSALILDGNHPTLAFNAIVMLFGLDDSFAWTDETFEPYATLAIRQL